MWTFHNYDLVYNSDKEKYLSLKYNVDPTKSQNKAFKSFFCHISPRARALGLQKVKIEEKHKKQKKRQYIYLSIYSGYLRFDFAHSLSKPPVGSVLKKR